MTKTNFKPVYAENNADWRIRYASNARWELQERYTRVEGSDRRKHYNSGWITHNENMSYENAIVLLATRNLTKKAS